MLAYSEQAGWQARLELGFERDGLRTRLARRRHFGPLRVQRPFYPEGGRCHVYLIHPPGGIVGGDSLELDVSLDAGAQALVTTPAATKFYRSAGPRARLEQDLGVCAGAALEWLPQETIVFDGAQVAARTRVRLQGDARFLGWETACLGRTAGNEPYRSGRMEQRFELWRNGRALFIDRAQLDAQSPLLTEAWGLAGYTVSATLLACPADRHLLDAARAVLETDAQVHAAASLLDDVLVVRVLGHSTERVTQQMVAAWTAVRPDLIGCTATPPRIWST